MPLLRTLLPLLLLLSLVDARAVVVAGSDTTPYSSAPSGDRGWSYVGSTNYSNGSVNAGGVYLGQFGSDYWVLTANHVAVAGFTTYTLGDNTYNVISGSQVGTLDLYVFRIAVTSEADPINALGNLALASTSPTVGADVTLIGYGQERSASLTTWYVDRDQDPWTWSTTDPTGSDATYQGYTTTTTMTKHWGSNTSEGTKVYGGTSYLETDFDAQIGQTQAVLGDSGGGVFVYNAGLGQYELAGLIDTVRNYSGQPNTWAVFGNDTEALNIATYRGQILATIPEPGTVSLFMLGLTAAHFVIRRKRK